MMAFHLGRVHWLDVFTPPLEQHAQRLVETVGRFLVDAGEPSSAPAPPRKPTAAGTPIEEGNSANSRTTTSEAPQQSPPRLNIVDGSRWKATPLLVGSLAFVVMGIFLLGSGGGVIGWMTILFFGLGVLVAIAQIAQPNRLLLSDENLVFQFALRKRTLKIDWLDIDKFFLYNQGHYKFAAFKYLPDRAPHNLITKVNQNLGVDGTLAAGWTIPAEELIDLLNQYRLLAQSRSNA